MSEPRVSIRKAIPASQLQQMQVQFDDTKFNAAIDSKGYNIVIEKALRCPCEANGEHAKSNCQNCMGSGYFFINPLKTKAIATGINSNTKYKEWSSELIGTISLTVRDDGVENLSFYDKITFTDKVSRYSEIVNLRQNDDDEDFVFTTYKVKEITEIFIFVSPTQKLRKLEKTEYSINAINPCVIDFNIATVPTDFNRTITVRYLHQIQYNIIDLPHELRASFQLDRDGKQELISLPMNAVARRSHLIVVEKMDYDGTGWQDNSYLP